MTDGPLTRRRKFIVLILTLLAGASRLVPSARSIFDWDEALFALGVREYDVALHHPHPPGYPLFVAAAKLVHLAGGTEFSALRAVVVVASLTLFPLMFLLAREIGFDFTTAVCAALLFVSFPNVWIYGGTAFSDVPAVAATLGACLLLLRGRRSPGAFVGGMALLALAAGMRPASLLAGIAPALLALPAVWKASRAAAAGGVLLGAAIVGAAYGGAAFASASPAAFTGKVGQQSEYLRRVDSWHNPSRHSLSRAARTFWLWPVEHRGSMTAVALLAVAGALEAALSRRRAPMLAIAVFAPLAAFSWLQLDVASASRYAISYMALHALLAADGLRVVSRGRRNAQAAVAALLAAVMLAWSWPAARLQHEQKAPGWEALDRAARVPASAPLYVSTELKPQAELRLGTRPYTLFTRPEEISIHGAEPWVVAMEEYPGAITFAWPQNPLWKIVRRRNFVASVFRGGSVRYGSGWYPAEGDGRGRAWRWMAGESELALPSARGKGRLSIRMSVPAAVLPQRPVVEVRFGSRLLDRFAAGTESWERQWVVDADQARAVRIRTTGTVVPRSPNHPDPRALGLRLDALSWTPLR